MRRRTVLLLGLPTSLIAMLVTGAAITGPRPIQAGDAPQSEAKLVPVDRSMHEFMEYYFQPTYLRLKPVMAAAPADNAGWKAIKADSLLLAEGGNLLLLRTPLRD